MNENRIWGIGTTVLLVIAVVAAFLTFSLRAGGHVAGFTRIDPGNVGLVIDNYTGTIEPHLMPAGTNWQGLWETTFEIPTQQQTITLDGDSAIQVNTPTNMLKVDVSVQYVYDSSKIFNLYNKYQDQFESQDTFKEKFITPDIKSAMSIAIGDMDTATALRTDGKQTAQNTALQALQKSWGPEGITFTNVAIRGIEQDDTTKGILASLNEKQVEITNAQTQLKQQVIDNQTVLLVAKKDAEINRLQNSTLTDLLIDDTLLSNTHQIYLDSNTILGAMKK